MILQTLYQQCIKNDVKFFDEYHVVDLIRNGDAVAGVVAVNIDTGRVVWKADTEQPLMGGVLATGGDLVFTGEGNGYFNAYDARKGKKLWSFQAGAGVTIDGVDDEQRKNILAYLELDDAEGVNVVPERSIEAGEESP